MRFISVVLLLIPAFCFVQSPPNEADDAYLIKYDSLIIFKISANNEFERFKQQGDNYLYDIRPNIALINKLSFNYRFLSVGYSFLLPFIPGNNDDAAKGKTKISSFQLKFSFSKWTQEFGISRENGFYLNNTGDFIPGWDASNDPYIQLPDLKYYSIKGSTQYKFNPHFSLKALSSQTEGQLKSCGSFIPMVSYNYSILDNLNNDTIAKNGQRSDNFELLFSCGYLYTYVIHQKWFASAGLFAGAGYQKTWLDSYINYEHYHNIYSDPLYSGTFKAGAGYSSKRFVAGTEFSVFRSIHNENKSALSTTTTRQYLHIFVGYRLKAPKILRKTTDKAAEIIPLLN